MLQHYMQPCSLTIAQQQSCDIVRICTPLFNIVPMSAFLFLKVMPGDKIIALSTHCKWIENIYRDTTYALSKTLSKINSKVSDLSYYAQPWSHQERSWKKIMVRTGLEGGINLWKRTGNCIYLFGFSGFIGDDYSKLIIQFIDTFKIFSNHFENRASTFIDMAEEYPFTFSQLPEKKLAKPSDPFKKFIELTPIKYFPIVKDGENFTITYKQALCVQKMIEGKGSKEIAKEMRLSSRTIEKHIEKIKLSLRIRHTHEIISIYQKSRDCWM
jgi:DNA-binding CsgD family transcriptional regulator